MIKKLFLVALATVALTACSDEDDTLMTNIPTETPDVIDVDYNSEGYWDDCYNQTVGGFEIDGLVYSHTASYDAQWDYSSWYGFCPSVVSDTKDYAADNAWTDHQWASITGGGRQGRGSQYIVGFWNSANPQISCTITAADGSYFDPQSIYVANNTYAYYSMLNGSAWNKAFDETDWYKLTIEGVTPEGISGTVEVKLADGKDILSTWKQVDLSGIGQVSALIFSVSSSDTGQWGMNNPAYFCISPLAVIGK